MKKLFTILVALSALGLVLSGCSKAEEGATDGGTPAPAPEKTE